MIFAKIIYGVYDMFCADKGTCSCTQMAEEITNHRTNVRLLCMLNEGRNYIAVGRHCGIKQFSFICYIKEECAKFLTLRVFKQERNVSKC